MPIERELHELPFFYLVDMCLILNVLTKPSLHGR